MMILGEQQEGNGLVFLSPKKCSPIESEFVQATPCFNNPVNLKRIIAMIDEEDWSAMDVDVKGAAFEGLLEKGTSEDKKGGRTVACTVANSSAGCLAKNIRLCLK